MLTILDYLQSGNQKQNWWPQKLPGSTILQSFDLSVVMTTDQINSISSISAAAAPSGQGEIAISDLTFSTVSKTVSLIQSSGQPTRVYIYQFNATLSDDEIIEWLVYQGVGKLLPTDTAPLAPNPGYGTPIISGFSPSADFTNVRNSMYLPIFAGF